METVAMYPHFASSSNKFLRTMDARKIDRKSVTRNNKVWKGIILK